MADDVILLDGSGNPYTVATDDIGTGRQAQRIKPVFGVDGTGTDVSASNPFPVVQTGNNPARVQDGSGNAITSTGGALDVNVKTSAVGSTVGTENGTIASGHTNVAEVMAMPYSFTGDAGHTRAGAIPWFTLDLDESAEQVKATATIVYGFKWYNRHATLERYLKWYDHASPTVGTTVPVDVTPMKPNTEGHLWCGPPGIGFTTALSVAATTGFANTDTGAPGLNEVFLTVFRK